MRRLLLVLTLGLIITACSSEGETQTVTDDTATAPDFSLMLGDGSTFTLSEETRPVFMVFWAEW